MQRRPLKRSLAIADDPGYPGLYCRISDRFGDNGLIPVVVGRWQQDPLHIDLWLMSCRGLKRDVEFGMLDAIAQRATAVGIEGIFGYYLSTGKTAWSRNFYPKLGFQPCLTPQAYAGQPALIEGATVWIFELHNYTAHNNTSR